MSISLTANRLNEADGFLKQMPNNITSFLEVYSGLNAETVAYMSEAQKSILKTMTLDALRLQKQIDDAKLLGQPTDEASSKLALLKDSIKEMGDAANASAIQAREAGKSFASGIQGGFNDALKGLMHNEKTAGKSAFQTFADKLKQNLIDSTISSFSAGVTNSLGFGKGDAVEKMASGLGEGIFKMFDKGLNMIPGASTASKATGTFLSKDVGNFFKNDVGNFFGFAEGGPIVGPGTGTSDSIMAKLSNGEFVINAKSTAKYGNLINAINNDKLPKFALGGAVSQPNAYSNRPALFSNTPVLSQATSTVITVDGGEDLIASAKDLSNASTDLTTSAGIGASLWQQIADMYNSVGDTALNVGGTIVDVGKEVGKFFVDKSKWVWDGTINLYDKAKGLLNTAGNFIWDGVVNIAGTIKDNLPSVSAIVDWGSAVYNKSIIPTITEKGAAAATAIIDWGSTAYKNTIDMGKEIGTKIESIAKNIWEGSDGNGGIAGSISTAYKNTVDFTNTIGTNLSDKASTIWTSIKDGIGTAWTGTVELGSAIGTGLLEKATPIWNSIKDGISIDPTSIDFSNMFTVDNMEAVGGAYVLKPFTYMSSALKSVDFNSYFSLEKITKGFKTVLTPFTWIRDKVSAMDPGQYLTLDTLAAAAKNIVKPFTWIGAEVTKIPFSDYLSVQGIKEVGTTLLKPFEYIGTEINKVDWAGLFRFDPSKIFPNLSNDISGDIAKWFGNIDLPAFEPSQWASEIKSLGKVAFDFLTDLVKGIRIDSVASLFPQATGGLAGTGKDIPLSGLVKGPGTGTSDSIPVRLSNGEYVIPAKQTAEYAEVLNQIRAGTFGKGLPEGVTLGEYAAGIKKGTYSTKDNKGFFDALGNLKTYDANGNPTGHYWMPEYAPIMDSLGSAFTSGLPSNSSVNYGGKDYGIAAFNKLMMKGISGAGQLVRTALGKYSWDNTGEMSDWAPTMSDTAAVGTSKLDRQALLDSLNGKIPGLGSDQSFSGIKNYTTQLPDGTTAEYRTWIDKNSKGQWERFFKNKYNLPTFSEASKDALIRPNGLLTDQQIAGTFGYEGGDGGKAYIQSRASDYAAIAAHNKWVKMHIPNPKVFDTTGTASDRSNVFDENLVDMSSNKKLNDEIAATLNESTRFLGNANTNKFNIGKVVDASLANVGGNQELKGFLEKAGYTPDAAGIDKLISDDKNASILKQVATNASKTNQVALNGYSIPANVMASLIADKQLGMGHWGLDSNTGSYNYTEDDVANGTKIRETILGLTNTQGETIAERVPVDKPALQLDTQGKWKFPEIKVPAETQQKISAQLVKKIATKQTKVSDWIQPKVPAKTSTTPYMTVDLSTRKVGLNQGSDPFAHIKELLSPAGVKKFGSDSVKMASYLADKLYKTGTDTAISLKDFYNSMTADGYIDAGKVGALPDFKLPDTLFGLDNVKTQFPFDAKLVEGLTGAGSSGYSLFGKTLYPNDVYFPHILNKNDRPELISGAKANLDLLAAYIKAGGAMTSEQTLGAEWVLSQNKLDINKLRPPTMLDKIGNWLIKPAGADAGVPPVLQAFDTSTAAGLSQFYPKIFSDSIYTNKALDSITGAVGSPVSPAELDLLSNDINFNELTSSLSGKLNQDWGANILTDIRANSNLPTVIDQSTYPNPNYGLWDRVLSWVGLSDKAQTLTAEQYYDYRLYKDYKPLAVSKPSGPSNFKFTTDPITGVPMFAIGSGNLLKDWKADPNPVIQLAKDVQGTGMASNWDAGWKNDFGFSNNYMADLSDGVTAMMASMTTNPGATVTSILKTLGENMLLSTLIGLGSSILTSLFTGSSSSDYYGFGGMATGGLVKGPGTGVSDSIPTMLSNGEFVINAAATARNRQLLEAINSGASISSAASPIMAIPTASKSADGANSVTNNSVINMNITGDISRQTRAEISQMLPQIAAGVNQYNRERNYRG
jgi:hypothetical protein